MAPSPVNIFIIGVAVLLGIGFYSLMVSHNLIKLVIAIQILVKSALLALITAGFVRDEIQLAQSLALNVIIADTIVAVIGIALAVQVRRRVGTLDVRDLSKLKG